MYYYIFFFLLKNLNLEINIFPQGNLLSVEKHFLLEMFIISWHKIIS